jgi:hypothetical protein
MGEHPAAPAMAGVRNQSPVAAFTAVFMPIFGVTWRQTLSTCALLAALIARKQGFPLGGRLMFLAIIGFPSELNHVLHV